MPCSMIIVPVRHARSPITETGRNRGRKDIIRASRVCKQPEFFGDPRMALYESDHTKFMREMMDKHPEWAEDQRAGRAIWWDRKSSPQERQAYAEAREEHRPYPYDVHF